MLYPAGGGVMVKRSHFIGHLWSSITFKEDSFVPENPPVEDFCRHLEAELAKDISPVLVAYSEGRISASELLCQLARIDDGYELLYEL